MYQHFSLSHMLSKMPVSLWQHQPRSCLAEIYGGIESTIVRGINMGTIMPHLHLHAVTVKVKSQCAFSSSGLHSTFFCQMICRQSTHVKTAHMVWWRRRRWWQGSASGSAECLGSKHPALVFPLKKHSTLQINYRDDDKVLQHQPHLTPCVCVCVCVCVRAGNSKSSVHFIQLGIHKGRKVSTKGK